MERNRSIIIGLISTTLIGLEMVWTRIYSAEFFYTFAFLTLSFAVMGLGLGALSLRLFPILNRRWVLGTALCLCGVSAVAGPPIVFRLGLDFSLLFSSWGMLGRLLAASTVLGTTFFLGGVALATVFKRGHRDIPRLYRADLTGAAAGVLVAITLMNAAGTQLTAFWIAVPVLFAAALVSHAWLRAVPVLLIAAVVSGSGEAGSLLESSREERAPVIYKHWDAMAKIKVFDYGGEARGINIDNVANTPVLRFDGDWAALADDSNGIHWDIDVGYLVRRFDDCTFLSLGSGGGWDIVQALDKGATSVHAVEVNRHIVKMMREGDPGGYLTHDSTAADSTGRIIAMPEFSGNIYNDPRVTAVAEDARTYVKRHPNTFDVIFSLSSNTWAALGSGSFALAENYLFTTEAFVDYWRALTDEGFLSMEHQVYMPRIVSEVMTALRIVGVDNPLDHFAVYDFPGLRRNVLLLSKRPLDDEIRRLAYGELTRENFGTRHLLFPPPDSVSDNLINRIVTNGWQAEQDSAAVNISPCSDDRPFVAQMGMWKNLDRDKLDKVSKYAEFRGMPLSKIAVIAILLVAVVLVLPLNLLPYLRPGPKLGAAPWFYFFCIGMAFMAVEIVLIQRYTLFIGASVYSIATVLLTLLLASGIGSRYANRVGDTVAFAFIAGWLLLEVYVLRGVASGLANLPAMGRVLVSAAFVFPLGFFMGMPFPKGGSRVGALVDWGFAVNGAASVVGATMVVMVAFSYGFNVALVLAAAVYGLAWMLLKSPGWKLEE